MRALPAAFRAPCVEAGSGTNRSRRRQRCGFRRCVRSLSWSAHEARYRQDVDHRRWCVCNQDRRESATHRDQPEIIHFRLPARVLERLAIRNAAWLRYAGVVDKKVDVAGTSGCLGLAMGLIAIIMIGMKVTKEKSAEHRRALVRAASKLFRRHGIDGVGVADVAKEAGLTHGALYAHFPSKDALAAVALADGLRRSHERTLAISKDEAPAMGDILDFFITKRHRDNIATGCAIAASGSEIARQDKSVSRSLAEGFDRMARHIEAAVRPANANATARERALAIAAAEVGALIVARGVAKANPQLSDEILAASRHVLGEIGGER